MKAALITNLGCILYGFQTVGGYVVGDSGGGRWSRTLGAGLCGCAEHSVQGKSFS